MMLSTSGKRVPVYLPTKYPEDCLPANWRDYGCWLTSHLYIQQHLDRRYRDGAYIPLYSQILREILPRRHYKAILSGLIQSGVVETDNDYSVGIAGSRGHSKGYRLTDTYRDLPFRRRWLEHPELASKLASHRERREQAYQPVHRHLLRNLSGLQIIGDYPKVSLPLVAIAHGDYIFTVCKQGRVHTPLTNMSREYRKNIRWNGQELFQIDIRNSQPLFLALTLQRQAKQGNTTAQPNKERDRQATTPNQPPTTRQTTTHHPHNNHPHNNHPPYVVTYSSRRLNDEADQLVDVCVAGRFYETLVEPSGLDREAVKELFFAVAYGGRLDMRTRVGCAFEDLFPACFKAIRDMKPWQELRVKGEPRPPKDPDLGELARRMQRLESDLVIGRVCDRIRLEYPKACLLTLHDSLITTESYISRFADILLDEFDAVYGIRPQLKSESFAV